MALKLEHHSIDPSHLEYEAERFQAFQNVEGFPKIYSSGQHDDFRVMALELLGPSLEDVFAYCECLFSLKTTLMIVDQLIVRLEKLHAEGIVHRDIKPQNFVLGSGVNGNLIYIIDLGTSDRFNTPCSGDEEGPLPWAHLIGTARFASIRGHQGHGRCMCLNFKECH